MTRRGHRIVIFEFSHAAHSDRAIRKADKGTKGQRSQTLARLFTQRAQSVGHANQRAKRGAARVAVPALRIDCRPMKTLCENPRPEILRDSHQRAALTMLCIAVGVLASPLAIAQQGDPSCGNPFVNGFGPHDYRVEQGYNRKIVEDYHFLPRVESLISGMSSSLGGDIDYTLRAFPNHHRALISMMNLGARLKNPMPPGAQFSVECYFKRALQFRPDDTIARMIYAKYLATNVRKPEAIRQLEFVVQATKENGFSQYNAGLIYFEMGEFDKALLQAHRAMSLGFERPAGLKQQLEKAGKWVDALPDGPEGAASGPAAPAAGASAAISASQPSR